MDPNRRTEELALPHLFNARDLGGMACADGAETSAHRLVRSDALDHLTKDEADRLYDYSIRTIIDLRSEAEAQIHPDTIVHDPRFHYYNIPLLRINADDIGEGFIQDVISSSLGAMYIWLLENSRPYFAEVLRTILQEKDGAVLFHCAHGKDRTGMIAAIFYLLCGVRKEDIIENYAVSYDLIQELVAPLIADTEPHVHHIYRSDASNMEMLLNYLDEKYQGDIRVYLQTAGLSEKEIEALRSRLL